MASQNFSCSGSWSYIGTIALNRARVMEWLPKIFCALVLGLVLVLSLWVAQVGGWDYRNGPGAGIYGWAAALAHTFG